MADAGADGAGNAAVDCGSGNGVTNPSFEDGGTESGAGAESGGAGIGATMRAIAARGCGAGGRTGGGALLNAGKRRFGLSADGSLGGTILGRSVNATGGGSRGGAAGALRTGSTGGNNSTAGGT